jgi:3'-phosphoadenosine 5'-phosphosulfate sulfotransferase (PAPS reductase)/FAD synthetase
MRTYICFNSGGNDSIATLEFMVLNELPATARVISLYTNTGWAADYWEDRMKRVAGWCGQRGIEHVELGTKGFEQLVLDGDAGTIRFPNGMRKTCTERLKILPAKKWMDMIDPDRTAICVLGVRRSESKRRVNTPIFEASSPNHGGRSLWKPLAEYGDEARDGLLVSAGFEPLPHRSDECEMCIHANRDDLRRMSDRAISRTRALEVATGKVMFRPKAYAGAVGIDEVMRWAHSERGKFKPAVPMPDADDGETKIEGCEDDFCGL